MTLIAIRQLLGDYGRANPGQTFETTDEIGRDLISRGLARHANPPRVLYEVRNGKFIPGEERKGKP